MRLKVTGAAKAARPSALASSRRVGRSAYPWVAKASCRRPAACQGDVMGQAVEIVFAVLFLLSLLCVFKLRDGL